MDLITIIKIMRDAKECIIISISCFVFVGVLATFMLPQKWTSKLELLPIRKNSMLPDCILMRHNHPYGHL
ncbi:Wzz/FepE/Etk N-terminal domain-containing protein [Pluralibacter sp.]|uniref:Wzz/FepE/Etk N-terminal domain-containing protein n=1 Tax=Pluralibacter sp. TaxID=1920032 RepID=UPI00345CBE81|nr:hypothetical protein [Pluralibacter sp.]